MAANPVLEIASQILLVVQHARSASKAGTPPPRRHFVLGLLSVGMRPQYNWSQQMGTDLWLYGMQKTFRPGMQR